MYIQIVYYYVMFEWDEKKRERNLDKHKLDFVDACQLFDDRAIVNLPAHSAIERRSLTVGKIGSKFLLSSGRKEAHHGELSLSEDHGMKKKEHIKTYTAEQISCMESRSDWERVDLRLPAPKATLNMRVDRDILEFFKNTGRGYQTKINAVLRAYKDAHTISKGG